MSSTFNRSNNSHMRIYDRADSVVFLKTKEAFGGLSNMAGGFPLKINGIPILTSEALYQICRFPHLPDVQKLIIAQKSPMAAKMKGKPYRTNSRQDWDQVQVKIMRWCLRVKLAQNWTTFSRLLLETDERLIVEQSRRDAFWGAKPVDEQTLVGMNVLGRLLMELREEVKSRDRTSLLRVEPIDISNFLLYGKQIQTVEADGIEDEPKVALKLEKPAPPSEPPPKHVQVSLFDQTPPKAKIEPRRKKVEQAGGLMDDLKPYPAMKESGFEWLGRIPVHWGVLPNRALFDEVKDRDYPNEQMLSVTIKNGVIRQAALLENSSKKDSSNLDRSYYKLVQPGDIAYNKMRAWQGAVGVSDYRGIISPAYVVQRPRSGVNSLYFHHLLRTPAFAKEAERWSYGITSDMWSLRPEHFKMIYECLPPLHEQAAIVRFLNHMTLQVRRYVRAKQKLIELLEEQKHAIIHRSVTRGLDSDVPLKPSGVEWIGEIPEHWEIVRVKVEFYCLNARRIPLSGPERGAMTSRLYDYYGASGVIDKVDDYLFDDELLLIAEDGANLVLRNLPLAIIARGKFWVNNHAHILKPKRGNLEYMAAVMESLNYRPWISGAAQPKLTKDRLMSIAIAVPPRAEQDQIIATAGDEAAILRDTISRVRHEIELLREYRTRLIADVVTGKLDVRETAANLPDELDKPEPHDEADDSMDEGNAMADDLDATSEEDKA